MALTKSKMVELGSIAPNFSLIDTVSGKMFSLPALGSSKGVLVMFVCNHCPYVKHIADQLAELANDYVDKGIKFFAISSNDPIQYPDDAPEKMKEEALSRGYCFPYLFDETQSVAKSYGAECTPDFFLYDTNLKLVYRGQLDDSSPGNKVPVTGSDLRAALDAILSNQAPRHEQIPSMGCNIKWK